MPVAEPSSILLLPYRHLFRQGLIAIVAFMLPVFIVLYFLTVPHGTWLPVLAAHVALTLLVAFASALFFTTHIRVSPEGLSERGFFGRTGAYRLDQIGSIVFANTVVGGNTESHPQLFVCDHAGRQLVRMRGQFWSKDSMDAVIATLDVPLTIVDETVSNEELHAAYPGLLYWFEKRPLSK